MKVGVIGFGYWGEKVVNTLLSSGTDIILYDQKKIDESQLKPGINQVDDLSQLLETEDVSHIFVITPEKTHFQVALKVIETGKNVFIEKPMALTTQEARLLAKKAEERKVCLYVDYTFLFDPFLHLFKKSTFLVGSSKSFHSIRHTYRINRESILLTDDLLIHELYIYRFLFGCSVKKIVVSKHVENDTTVENIKLNFEGEGGRYSADLAWVKEKAFADRVLTVSGERGVVTWQKKEEEKLFLNIHEKITELHPEIATTPLNESILKFLSFNFETDKSTIMTDISQYIDDVIMLESVRNEDKTF